MKYIKGRNQLVMKNLNWIVVVMVMVGLVGFSNCGDDTGVVLPPEPTPQDIALANLTKAWSLGANGVKRDGSDVTSDFTGFTVTFTESGSWTSSGGEDVWPGTSGSWSFTSSEANDASSITIGGDVIQINVSATSLLMQFIIPDGGAGIGARLSGIDGDWVFSMEAN